MKLFLNNREVTITELKQTLDNLDYGPPDGGTYETLVLEDIDSDGNLYFEIEVGSSFG